MLQIFNFQDFGECTTAFGIFQMGFFAEAGPVQIFVSNHVSLFLICLYVHLTNDMLSFFLFFYFLVALEYLPFPWT